MSCTIGQAGSCGGSDQIERFLNRNRNAVKQPDRFAAHASFVAESGFFKRLLESGNNYSVDVLVSCLNTTDTLENSFACRDVSRPDLLSNLTRVKHDLAPIGELINGQESL